MTIAPAKKFNFDTQFDAEAAAFTMASRRVSIRFSEQDLEAANAEGYAAGLKAGIAQAASDTQAQIEATLSEFAASAASLLTALNVESATLRAEASKVALSIACKLAPALIATRPQAEIEAVLKDCLTHLNREPHIVLRVAETLIDDLKDRVERMALERGLSGRVILLAEPGMASGDCTVEWADGGVSRNRAEIEEEISNIINRYISSLPSRKEQ
jgi:flagellar assembly protein FliH